MPTSLTAAAQSMLANSGMSSTGINALQNAAQNSPYFAGLLNDGAGKGKTIEMGAPNGGTAYGLDKAHPNAIVIDPTWVPGSGANNSDANNPNVFATTIAHEFGHAVLPGGNNPSPANSPDVAATTGGNNEGVYFSSDGCCLDELACSLKCGRTVEVGRPGREVVAVVIKSFKRGG